MYRHLFKDLWSLIRVYQTFMTKIQVNQKTKKKDFSFNYFEVVNIVFVQNAFCLWRDEDPFLQLLDSINLFIKNCYTVKTKLLWHNNVHRSETKN